MPTGVTKICVTCGEDVAQLERVREGAGTYYCQSCWEKRHGRSGAKVTVRIGWRGASREIKLSGQTVSVGSSTENHVVLPFAWVRPRHLTVHQDAGIVRVKSDDPKAHAFIADEQIGLSGVMLPPGSPVQILAPDGAAITLEFVFKGAHKGAVLVDDDPTPSHSVHTTAEVAGISPLDEEASLFNTKPPPSSARIPRTKTPSNRMGILVGVSLLIVFALLVSALIWNQVVRSQKGAVLAAELANVDASVSRAQTLIKQGHYVEAKASIDAARQVAGNRPAFVDYIFTLDALSARPEIKFGGLGYILMEGQWLAPETARAWKEARDRDDPKIEALHRQAAEALAANKNMDAGQRACEEALALMTAEPVHPHPRQEELTGLRDDLKNKLIEADMTAKGFVLYEKRWVTPAEKFKLEQIAKGLAEYKGKWMSKEEAFAAEQTDKGLVLFQGKWMTPDEQKVAQGFVKFEDAWITPEEKTRILQQRAQAAEAERERIERERVAAAAQAERLRLDQEAINAKMPDAYTMSQQFVRDLLKSPASAQFQEYGNAKVTVTYKDGWYTVMAVVDAENSYGAMLRSTYICKLKCVGGDRWQTERTFLLDN